MPEYKLGFKTLADQLGPDVVGDPLDDETYFDAKHSFQTTTNGLMWYVVGGQPFFLPKEGA